MYRCAAKSVEGFIQQLAVSYVGRGYWFYVAGTIPEGKDPAAIDAKLIRCYGIDLSKWARARRKARGLANMQYLRHGPFFVLLATHGRHLFFEREGEQVRDARRTPIRYAGYSVSYRGGHPHVRIDQAQYNLIKAFLVEEAVRRSSDSIAAAFRSLPFEPYAPVRRQLLNLLRAVNKARRTVRLDAVPVSALRLHRRIVKPFGEETAGGPAMVRPEQHADARRSGPPRRTRALRRCA